MATNTITIYPNNIFEDGTVTVTGTADTGYPEARLYDRSKAFLWKDTVTEAKTFHVDYGSATAIDLLAINTHNFNGKAMQWQYSDNDADWLDAVTDWTQGDNNQIVKVTASTETHRYWRVTLASITNPQCGEIMMSPAYQFDVQYSPNPSGFEQPNVQWNRTVGGIERSTKFGDARRNRTYTMWIDDTDLTNFNTAMNLLDDWSLPFFFKDHDANYYWTRFTQNPIQDWDHNTYTHITLNLIEML